MLSRARVASTTRPRRYDSSAASIPLSCSSRIGRMAGLPCDFGTSDTVWHCNYVRQDETINYLAAKLGIVLD